MLTRVGHDQVLEVEFSARSRPVVDHGGSAGFITGSGNMAHIFENTAGKLLELDSYLNPSIHQSD